MRAVIPRWVAACAFIAIGSLWVQLGALVGEAGVLPAQAFVTRVAEAYGSQAPWLLPGWQWVLGASDTVLNALCAASLVLSVVLMRGTRWDGWLWLLLWSCFLSLCGLGQVFLGFQWDSLLLEMIFACALLADWGGMRRAPSRWSVVLFHWIAFKLFFFGGLVKLTSGDPTWRDGTALAYHFWTQPLPGPVSLWFAAWPSWLLKLGVWLTFVVELVLPFGIVCGARVRRAVAVPMVGLMVALALTGNYGYFQLLSIGAALALLDDAAWERVFGSRWRPQVHEEPARPWRSGFVGAVLVVNLCVVWPASVAPTPVQWLARTVAPVRTVNPYGLFARMTTERPLVQFETSDDGVSWTPVALPYQTGRVDERPRQVAPHMPRLDWQVWFAGLGDCRRNAWVYAVQQGLVRSDSRVWTLFRQGRAPERIPRFARSIRVQYTPQLGPGGDHWTVTRLGAYCPVAEGEAWRDAHPGKSVRPTSGE